MSSRHAFQSIVLVGFGSIGQALLPALLRHVEYPAHRITVITASQEEAVLAKMQNVAAFAVALTPDNLSITLKGMLSAGDLLINVSTNVSSLDLITICREQEAYYLDTCVEPWFGGYDASRGEQATNAWLRQQALTLNDAVPNARTALIAHGANPGIISHLVCEGLRCLATMRGISTDIPFAEIAHALGIKVIQIAECDTQQSDRAYVPGLFANTWSVDGFKAEAQQRAELGWGTHEKSIPAGSTRLSQGGEGIVLPRPGAEMKVKSWVPSIGEMDAYLITHHEALSIASLLTLGQPDSPLYRPTVYYAYSPAPLTRMSLEAWKADGYCGAYDHRLLRDSITQGYDQMGALFVFDGGAYWYGSTVDIEDARAILPSTNATALQVVGGILAGMQWIANNPEAGVVEAEVMDHIAALAVAQPYLGRISGMLSAWQPSGSGELQFQDFLIS